MSAKDSRTDVRMAQEQKQRIQRAANLTGRTLSDFVRTSADEKAKETLKEYNAMKLSKKDSKIFAEALLNDTEPGKELKEAARRYKENISE